MRRTCSLIAAIVALIVMGNAALWAADAGNAAQPQPPQDRILKKRVGIIPTETQLSGWSWDFGQDSLCTGLSEMLTTSLVNTGRFIVVERGEMDAILAEQQLTQQGVTTAQTGAQKGQALGAEFLVKGVITEFEYGQKGGGGGISLGPVSVGGSKARALLGLDVRIFHSSTTEVVASEHVQGKASRGSAGVGLAIGSLGVHAEGFEKTPLGQAMREAVDKWVAFVSDKLGNQPWEGRVVKADADDKIYVNAGSAANVRVGDRFQVLHEGEKLVDPATGLELGAERKAVGAVEITEVQEKYSIARAVDGHGFQRGDVLKETGR